MNQQQIIDNLLSCHDFAPALNKATFNPAKLQALPRGYTIKAYTDTSITWAYKGRHYYSYYTWKIKAWTTEECNHE